MVLNILEVFYRLIKQFIYYTLKKSHDKNNVMFQLSINESYIYLIHMYNMLFNKHFFYIQLNLISWIFFIFKNKYIPLHMSTESISLMFQSISLSFYQNISNKIQEFTGVKLFQFNFLFSHLYPDTRLQCPYGLFNFLHKIFCFLRWP